MAKQKWKPGNMVYPLPAVLVSCGDKKGNINVMTAAWTGTICSDPPMVYVSVRKERHSHHMIQETREYVINLTTEKLAWAADFCGVRSGRDLDKFKEMKLTPVQGELQYAPMIEESPVSIECRVTNVMELGSHDMFMAEVTAVYVDEQYMDEKGTFHLEKAAPMVYSHGQYYGLGRHLGGFGYAVRKKPAKKGKK
ncbi:MAG TPA: flavin reductase family protein [Lachnospiraceae bacterium]|nr:flavin reductase family protein [Lachnospiraceae bacterium]